MILNLKKKKMNENCVKDEITALSLFRRFLLARVVFEEKKKWHPKERWTGRAWPEILPCGRTLI